ncbi:MAG: hypothetical protein IPF81_19560 [Bacteroidetes bacterium]|nr:hypothetical protein [Bacteroidota bacterium]
MDKLLGPAGMFTVLAKLMIEDELRTLPRATVPSCQERHKIEEPLGWPGRALSVELLYGV